MPDLGGRVVAFLEARRAAELADLIGRHGGTALPAPSLREVHAPDSFELRQAVDRVCDSQPRLVIFLTGVGTTTVFEAARHAGRESDLRRVLESSTVVVRGPKPAAVLRKLGVRIDVAAPPPNTTAEVLASVESIDVNEQTVVVQLYGEPNPALSQALAARGATVIELAPYVWDRPVDPKPIIGLLDALAAGRVDALLITSQAQVENLFQIAHDLGRPVKLDGVAIGVQGPVAESALRKRGYDASFQPEHGHMGALVIQAAKFFSDHRQSQGVA